MPAVSAMKNFLSNMQKPRQELQDLFDKILTFRHELPVENPKDEFAPTPFAEWLVDQEGGVIVYFDYAPWWRDIRRETDPDNHFKFMATQGTLDIFNYNISLAENLNINGDMECGKRECAAIAINSIDCFYVFNFIMNLITMQTAGIGVSDIQIANIYDNLLPQKKWESAYMSTIQLIKDGIL